LTGGAPAEATTREDLPGKRSTATPITSEVVAVLSDAVYI
jgi:hypothetical protein